MQPSRPVRRPGVSVAAAFRQEIEKSCAEGLDPDAMTLRLTHSDASKLKRDSAIAVSDISFADGVMRYLGVKVVEGSSAESSLDRGAA
jgi:hypothetical protein